MILAAFSISFLIKHGKLFNHLQWIVKLPFDFTDAAGRTGVDKIPVAAEARKGDDDAVVVSWPSNSPPDSAKENESNNNTV